MDADPDWPPQKTVWRGVLHQHAAGAALAGGIMLIIGAPGGRAKAGCAVYAGACFRGLGFKLGPCPTRLTPAPPHHGQCCTACTLQCCPLGNLP